MENKLSVSDLNSYIKGVFDDELVLHNISVYGELFQFSVSGNNTYFVLKGDECYLQCLKFGRIEKPELGTQITVFGSVEFYRKSGKVTFIAKNIQETGKGKQYAEFLELKNKLSAEGLFINKHELPTFIEKVAVVTSNRGAVIHDFLSVLSQNHSYIDVKIVQTKVQGEHADESLSSAILSADTLNCDLIVIARGGGSASDLESFNTESVVRAIAKCNTPTLSAIGHQTDYTLCDLASTQRAGTPSLASEMIAKINNTVIQRFLNVIDNLDFAIKDKFNKFSTRLYHYSTKIAHTVEKSNEKQFYKICSILQASKDYCSKKVLFNKTKIKYACINNQKSIKNKYMEFDKKLALSVSELEASNPLKILSQGYAFISKNGSNVKSSKELKNGDVINIRFYDGQASAEIKEK
ncbi:MAG: exodeoxyribonuclease VII large subunit [Clostridiales bacterium]|nr:exodeoxyribonuclease VII large subunit [Clostridiales bacterium]